VQATIEQPDTQVTNTRTVPPPGELDIHSIVRNPLNPRRRVKPGDVTDLTASITEHGVIEAIIAVTRAAFVAANPEHADQLEDDNNPLSAHGSEYVLIAGERRTMAGIKAGLDRDPGGGARRAGARGQSHPGDADGERSARAP
jgi:hypothetical protein